MHNSGFETIRTRNIEDIDSSLSEHRWSGSWPDQKMEALLDSLRKNCETPELLGKARQYICVGVRREHSLKDRI
jgi:hypothetical protein